MSLHLIKIPTGEVALLANNQLVFDGESEDDSARLVEDVAERLAIALEIPLMVSQIDPGTGAWEWETLIAQSVPKEVKPEPENCGKCGSRLVAGLCKDLTCPYSDWPQQVSVSDMETLSGDEIAAKFGLVRAEIHSDDRVFEVSFEASSWFVGASAGDILTLAQEEWGRCEEADAIGRRFESNPRVATLFKYIQAKSAGSRDTMGFEVTVNEIDAMVWLRQQRYGLWAQLVCEEHGVRFSRAQEPEIEGLWDWRDDNGNACEYSHDSADQAAINAVETLGLDALPPVSPLYLAYWSVDAFYSPNGEDVRQIVGPALFCEALSYDMEDIEGITGLSVGESWEARHYGPAHTVHRIR